MNRNRKRHRLLTKGNQIRKNGKRAAAIGTILFSLIPFLTACGSNKLPDESDTQGSQSAKGRYMEEEIALPKDAASYALQAVVQNKDKSLMFDLSAKEGKTLLYHYDAAASWAEEGEISALGDAMPDRMMIDENDQLYFGGYDEKPAFHLWRKEEDGAAKELLPEVFKIPKGEDYGMLPDFIAIGAEGKILISESDYANIYLPDGAKEATLAQDFIGSDYRHCAYLDGDEYLTIFNQQLVRYNARTGSIVESFIMPENESDNSQEVGQSLVFADEEGGIYFAGRSGLYHIAKNNTVWEQLIDGSLNSMGSQDLYLSGFFKGVNDDYYGVYTTMDDTMRLFHYDYNETVDAVPPETLTVYSLKDSPTVRQAAILLQKSNPQVKVDYRFAMGEQNAIVTEDAIRSLSAELLNGKGADVLILDGLPMESYKEKGILADVSGLFSKGSDVYLPNVIENFTDKDGAIYYMPARIKVPVIYGDPTAVAADQDLEKMAAYDKEPALFSPDIYENILNMTSYTCFRELFNKKGTVDEAALTRWLASVKSAGEKSNVQVSFSQVDAARLGVGNNAIPTGFGRQGAYNLVSEKCAAAAEVFDSIYSAMLSISAAKIDGSSLESIGGVYMPCVVAGINAGTANKENAEEFMQTLFSAELQDNLLNDGFPIRNDSLDKWADMEKFASVHLGSNDGGVQLNGEWPDRENREMILAIVHMVNVPAMIDTQIMNMIVDGSKDYLNGNGTLENAVRAIESKMKLYIGEKE